MFVSGSDEPVASGDLAGGDNFAVRDFGEVAVR
jgi:hypothetical protein